jgi:hypothetical protein
MQTSEWIYSKDVTTALSERVNPFFWTDRVQEEGEPLARLNAWGQPQRTREGRIKRAAKAYGASDPVELRRRLQEQGFEITQAKLGRSGSKAMIEVRYPEAREIGADGDRYQDFARLLLDHTGRAADRIQVGALRIACENQFRAPALEIRHTGRDHREFMADPGSWLNLIRGWARNVVDKVQGLRGISGGALLLNAALWDAPQLMDKAGNLFGRYSEQDGESMWAALQAFTRTRSPRLLGLTERLLSSHYQELSAGEVPAAVRS